MHSENLRGAKRRAQNLGVTEAPLEQFSEEGGKMISGGGGARKIFYPQKRVFGMVLHLCLPLGVARAQFYGKISKKKQVLLGCGGCGEIAPSPRCRLQALVLIARLGLGTRCCA